MTELLINKKDAFESYRVKMGNGFVDAIDAPADYKDYVSNESRLENGKRCIIKDRKIKEREVTLPFVIIASTRAETNECKNKLLGDIRDGCTISIPAVNSYTYKLVPIGYSSYHVNMKGNLCTLKIKFLEPNPTDR